MEETPNQGLGWFVLRTGGDVAELSTFYQRALQLPELRAWPGGSMLWAGGFSVFEINVGGRGAKIDGDRIESPCCWPVFASRELDVTEARIERHGGQRIGGKQRRYFKDPAGLPFALEAPSANADTEVRLDDVAAFTADITGLNGVELCVAEPSKAINFYVRVLSLKAQPSLATRLDLGDGKYLEFSPDGVTEALPDDREQLTTTFIFRVYEYENWCKRFDTLGIPVINRLEFTGGRLSYFVDNENHLFGFQERKPFDADVLVTQSVEDASARAARERRSG